jgi:hypothetical protein
VSDGGKQITYAAAAENHYACPDKSSITISFGYLLGNSHGFHRRQWIG